LKKHDGVPEILLEPTPDILAGLGARKPPGQVLVGFAAETGDEAGSVLDHARAKLARKGCDLLVANDVGAGRVFGSDRSAAVILSNDQPDVTVPAGSKRSVSDAIWDQVARRWAVP